MDNDTLFPNKVVGMKPSWSLEDEARKAGHKGWALVEPAVVSRALLAINHVLLSEPQAVQRLRAHAGRCLRVGWRADSRWLPTPPDLHLAITPAGLLEWLQHEQGLSSEGEFSLEVSLDEALAALGQARPLTHAVRLEGDAALASDLAWMLDHLRWDFEGDLGRLLPPAVAHGVARAGRVAFGLLAQLGSALRQKVNTGATPVAERDPWGARNGVTQPPSEGGSSGAGPQ